MGDIVTASGTKVYIGNAVSSSVDSIAEFEATSVWTEIGLVESLGEFGDKANPVTFSAVGDGRVRKAKGANDAGTMALTCAHDPTDAGQAAMEVAQADKHSYSFKVVLPDAPVGFSDTIIYFRGLVMDKSKNVGTNDNVIRNIYNVAINSELFTDPASS